jgi:Mg2+-importing ATPase
MAARGVLVRRLTAIENLGSMDVLCTDKTGTLTEGTIRLDGAYDSNAHASAAVLDAAAINARLQTGLDNPLDAALLDAHTPDLIGVRKLGEIPFDFLRRRLSVIVETPAGVSLIAKGAFDGLIALCATTDDGTPIDAAAIARLRARHDAWSRDGVRVVAVATRPIERRSAYTHEDETGLTFLGFLTFLDRPKADAATAVADLGRLGVAVKIVTGDNRFVAGHLAALVGMHADRLLTGGDLSQLAGAALWRAVEQAEIFAEVDPNQKEQIVLALKRAGHVVGFLGDGVNDAPAMHAADTSVSVERAVDVAREAADFVLLERDLDVLRGGIEEGRRTFANTLKYLLTTMSANLGNMISMAAASFVLPFLPLLAGQILLNNLLSDVPAVGLADDRVDPELVVRPSTWDIAFIVRFMMIFGVLSSAFDAITFVVLMRVFRVDVPAFRTGWFVESLLTELVIALVVRTRRPWLQSRPGRLLLMSSTVLMAVTLVVPYVPMAAALGFVPLPAAVLAAVVAITVLYVKATELVKRWFYRERMAV